ncbi:MAG: DNA polymerase III subunit gamma/tau [Candidatus Omnitrophota bacterium]
MSYIVFARKWRPKDFSGVLGQNHVVTTLSNAITQNRVAHAYIFSGPRGVGKTTTARVFAMALNCKNPPTPSPCGACDSCKEIASAVNLDVMEIDGASSRGIDEVRALRENIKFSPSRGKYKIYIIDEVHMLTEEAFNALLKTLEEPPAHAVFIFATTRLNKIPPTILSRCQRFEFRRLSASEITGKLKEIAVSEKVDIDDDALYLTARAAEGSMRDAESILDQLVSFCGRKIDLKSAASILGIVGQDALFAFTEKVIAKDTPGVLILVNEIISGGKDMAQFLSSLVGHFRNLLVAKVGKDLPKLIDLPAEAIDLIRSQAELLTAEDLLNCMTILMNAQEAAKKALSQRVPFELAAIRLTQREDVSSLPLILKKISELEGRIGAEAKTDAKPVIIPPARIQRRDDNESGEKNMLRGEGQVMVEVEMEEGPSGLTPLEKVADFNFVRKENFFKGAKEQSSITGLTLEKICEIWPSLIKSIALKKMSVAIFLRAAQPLKLEDDVFTIAFSQDNRFHKESVEANSNRQIIESALKEILGREVKAAFKVVEALENKVALQDSFQEEEQEDTHEVIKSALNIFGGNLNKEGRH